MAVFTLGWTVLLAQIYKMNTNIYNTASSKTPENAPLSSSGRPLNEARAGRGLSQFYKHCIYMHITQIIIITINMRVTAARFAPLLIVYAGEKGVHNQ